MKNLNSNVLKIVPAFCFLIFIAISVPARGKINLDYDGKADFLVFRPATGTWFGYSTETGRDFAVNWGVSTDRAVAADYDGDGITDVAVFRPGTGVWYVLKSSNGQMMTATWGLSTDDLVPADYDGDGQADFAVWRRSNSTWYVLTSTSGYQPQYFRVPVPPEIPSVDNAVPADYDGDGKTDFAVRFRSSWFIYQSESRTLRTASLSCETGVLMPNDFTGDGYADPGCMYMLPDVVYIWRHLRSQDNQQADFRWGRGMSNDLPVPDDYDGDGHTDHAVYRNGQWWIYPSRTLQHYVVNFGIGGDRPAQWENLQFTR